MAALSVHWPTSRRQVRAEGRTLRLAEDGADALFRTRPRGAQIMAWATQDGETQTPSEYDAEFTRFEQRWLGSDVSRPPNWVAFALVPLWIEFWESPEDWHNFCLRCTLDVATGSWVSRFVGP